MKKFLKYIILLIVTVMCASCGNYPIKGNTLVVTNEFAINENLSAYTLEYEDTRDNSPSFIKMIYDRNAFEVGDTLKLVKAKE